MSVPGEVSAGEALGVLSRFRVEFYDSLYARADTLFELTDSVLYADGPGRSERSYSLAIRRAVAFAAGGSSGPGYSGWRASSPR